MTEMGKRLKRLRMELDLKQGEFADKIELSQGVLSEIENGKKLLIDRNIRLICLTFGVNDIWLRTGQGAMFVLPHTSLAEKIIGSEGEPLTEDEAVLISIYRDLIPANQELILLNAKTAIATQENTKKALYETGNLH